MNHIQRAHHNPYINRRLSGAEALTKVSQLPDHVKREDIVCLMDYLNIDKSTIHMQSTAIAGGVFLSAERRFDFCVSI